MTMKIPGLNVPNFERGDYSLWIIPNVNYRMCHQCKECHAEIYGKPTKFCGECGSVMLNAIEAMAEYDSYIAESSAKNDKGGEQNA